jgi:hypothetical protein
MWKIKVLQRRSQKRPHCHAAKPELNQGKNLPGPLVNGNFLNLIVT